MRYCRTSASARTPTTSTHYPCAPPRFCRLRTYFVLHSNPPGLQPPPRSPVVPAILSRPNPIPPQTKSALRDSSVIPYRQESRPLPPQCLELPWPLLPSGYPEAKSSNHTATESGPGRMLCTPPPSPFQRLVQYLATPVLAYLPSIPYPFLLEIPP